MNNCHTESRRGRPAKSGRSVRIAFRLREGEHDDILERLDQVPPGEQSDYIRRVLAGASPELLDHALHESDSLTSALDGMWDDWNEDE